MSQIAEKRPKRELSDEQRHLRMPSKPSRRWRSVGRFDAEIERIRGEQERLRAEAEILRVRLPAAETSDMQTLAGWISSRNDAVGLELANFVTVDVCDSH